MYAMYLANIQLSQTVHLFTQAVGGLLAQFTAMMSENHQLYAQMDQLTSQVQKQPVLNKEALVAEIVSEVVTTMENHAEEHQLRLEKRPNLVMVGFPEKLIQDGQAGNPAQSDDLIVADIFAKAGADKSVIKWVFCLGKVDREGTYAHPIKILTLSYEQKMMVLMGQRKAIDGVSLIVARGKRVFLRHDWTPRQLKEDKKLHDELKQVQEAYPDKGFKIRNGELVEFKKRVPYPKVSLASAAEVTASGENEQSME